MLFVFIEDKVCIPLLSCGHLVIFHLVLFSLIHLYVGLFAFSCYFLRVFGLPDGSMVKNQLSMQETRVRSLGQEEPLEKEMATYSSILSWRISMNRKAWQAIVHEVAKSRTRLNDSHTRVLYDVDMNYLFDMCSTNNLFHSGLTFLFLPLTVFW